jgi:hypothetical protein
MLVLIAATHDLDLYDISFGSIVWFDTVTSLYHAKASRPPVRQDTTGYITQAAAEAAARTLATTMH